MANRIIAHSQLLAMVSFAPLLFPTILVLSLTTNLVIQSVPSLNLQIYFRLAGCSAGRYHPLVTPPLGLC
jgi:hypothetical protein